MESATKLNGMQIDAILDKVVPLISAPEDHEFFYGVLRITAENSTSSDFAVFIGKLLKKWDANDNQVER